MDRLTFCRENISELTEEELLEVYNFLCAEYSYGEFALWNDIRHIGTIFELMTENNLSQEDWENAIKHEQYSPSDKYIEVGREGIISFCDESYFKDFVTKKMNGEAMSMIGGYLQNKGISLPKYVIVHDVDNEEFHLHTLCEDGNPSSKKVIVGCESLHELFVLGKNYGVEKKDIVDYLKIDEVKQYS